MGLPALDGPNGPTVGPLDTSIDVSIVIVNWNTKEILRACLASIQQAVSSLQIETIVVDNASSDGSAEMVKHAFPKVHLLINGRNRGFAAANNQGFARAHGRYILLLNSDTVVLPGAIEEMARYMDANRHVGALGPQLLNEDHSVQVSVYPFPHVARDALVILDINRWPLVSRVTRWYGQRRDRRMSAQTGEVDWVMGSCLLIRREAVERVGVLDEGYFFNAEEMDLCYRLRQHRWAIVYLATATIIHLGGQSRARISAAHLIWFYKGKMRYYRLYHARWQYMVLRLAIALSSLVHMAALIGGRHRTLEARRLLSGYGRVLSLAMSG